MIDVISTKETARLAAKLKQIRERGVAYDAGLMNQVAAIAADVRARGDAALVDYARQFDNYLLEIADIRVDERSLRTFAAQADREVVAALREAIKRVREFHEHEHQESWLIDDQDGVSLGQRVTPIEKVGVYVPGGTASYPSSVVMNVVPAQVAGVDRIVVVTPPKALQENPAIAAALVELEVTEVYAVGGAQAVAALAYGTRTVPRVDKITGPGNRYVTAAKKLVYGIVGIDSLAGPSEVVVIADETARAGFVASDLLAQAEHSEDASSVLVTTSDDLAQSVFGELETQVRRLPRSEIVAQSLRDFGAIIIVKDMEEGCDLVNELAPEHLEIMAANEEAIAAKVRNAGAIFFGQFTPEAVGDYLAGPNHVLPTGGAARFSSALSVRDFVKRTNTVKFSETELARTAQMIATLARSEGLEAHARSALIRVEENQA
ncbi:MAG TPA: histidinol dehydrogenase [Pyrinomonadaceae bacterium]|nr:histidinol dehydrogenase [Pyrinomonadaceae bacterium]